MIPGAARAIQNAFFFWRLIGLSLDSVADHEPGLLPQGVGVDG